MFAGCCAGVAQLVEQLICNQQVGGSNPSTSSNFIDNMGDFPSGQRGQTVNLLAMPSVVRIHHPPPKSRLQKRSAFYFCAFRYSPPRKPLALPHSLYPSPTHRKIRFRRGDPCGRPWEGQSPSPTHRKIHFRRGGRPCPPAGACTAFLIMCHCEASAYTGCGNPYPPSPWPPCLKGAVTAKP